MVGGWFGQTFARAFTCPVWPHDWHTVEDEDDASGFLFAWSRPARPRFFSRLIWKAPHELTRQPNGLTAITGRQKHYHISNTLELPIARGTLRRSSWRLSKISSTAFNRQRRFTFGCKSNRVLNSTCMPGASLEPYPTRIDDVVDTLRSTE